MTAITWAHADQKLFVATKNLLHTITIHRSVPSLQVLCNLAISSTLPNRESSHDLLLPTRLKVSVAETFESVIQVRGGKIGGVGVCVDGSVYAVHVYGVCMYMYT